MRQLALRLTFITVSLAGTAFSLAQENPSSPPAVDQDMENLYDQMDQQSDQTSKKEDDTAAKASAPATANKTKDAKTPAEPVPDAKTITDLNRLQPFSDIAVIERRFLPKTHRFELSALGLTNLNNPFFDSFGATGALAYYFTEQWAVEGIGTVVGVAPRQVTSNLTSQNITTSNVVTAKNFVGGAVKWNPIYGKVSFLNEKIVPFDISFSLGGGVTGTQQGYEEPTVHLGTSQVFALSKMFGVRWDIDWNFYNAHATSLTGQPEQLLHNDLFFGLGINLYFPDAEYR